MTSVAFKVEKYKKRFCGTIKKIIIIDVLILIQLYLAFPSIKLYQVGIIFYLQTGMRKMLLKLHLYKKWTKKQQINIS